MKYVDRRLFIDAAPAAVYELLTDADRFVEWMAPEADIDARVGGTITWRHRTGDRCTGTFVELVPARRIVFTYGWDREDVGIPPGSTTVEITLQPRDGGTDLHLVHRDLPEPMVGPHDGGWANYLHRLMVAASGGDPGSDPLAKERVPSAREVGPA